MSTIRGLCLQEYLFSGTSPERFLSDKDRDECKVNKEYLDWEQQDQIIVSWLLSSISDNVLSRLVNCDTTYQIWKTVELYFATQVRSKISQFQTILKNTKKESMSMNDYLLRIRHVVDLLAMVDNKLSVKDHISAIFDGLPPEYETVLLSFETRVEPFTVEDVESILLAQESRIEKRASSTTDMSLNVAHLTHFSGSQGRGKGNFSQHTTGYNQSGGMNNYHGFNRDNGRGKGKGKFIGGGRGKVQCQLCGRQGHTVLKCYYRFDQNFLGPAQLQSSNNRNGCGSNYFSPMPQGHIAQFHSELSPQLSSFSGFPSSATAMLATPETDSDLCWYPDSGATNHVTANAENLTHKSEFLGPNQVLVGDGKGLPISHIGFSKFLSPLDTSKILSLNHILHVPAITKNLLSVSKFAQDNNVFFEFHPYVCFVKDQATSKVLLKGQLKDGLYHFDQSQVFLHNKAPSLSAMSNSPTTAHTSSKSPTTNTQCSSLVFSCMKDNKMSDVYTLWHNRLGHPS